MYGICTRLLYINLPGITVDAEPARVVWSAAPRTISARLAAAAPGAAAAAPSGALHYASYRDITPSRTIAPSYRLEDTFSQRTNATSLESDI